jgi:predicted MFS family arabinose efflux permease
MTGHALASVVGVPLGLAIASALDWRLAFGALLLLALPVALGIRRCVPRLPARQAPPGGSAEGAGGKVLLALSPALLLTFAVSGSAYAVGAYFAPFWIGNVGIGDAKLPLVYLAAGALSLFTSPLIGRLADRHGRFEVFTAATLLSIVVILQVTHAALLPAWLAVVLGAAFFLTVYGRWIPALALLSELPRAEHRGGFMMINGVVTQLSMGTGALAAGLMIDIDAGGRLAGFDSVGQAAAAVSLLAIPLAWKLAGRRSRRAGI